VLNSGRDARPCGHNRHGPKRRGAGPAGCCAPLRGQLGPHLTQCSLGRDLHPYQVPCHLDPSGRMATIDIGRKVGECCSPLGVGELGIRLTQCRLGRCLPPYQVASWSIQPFGHKRHGTKIGRLCPFGRGLGPHMWSGQRPTSMPSFTLIHQRLTTIHQRYRQTNRTDNGPIA